MAVWRLVKADSTRARPASPIAAASAGCASIHSSASASAPGSRGGTSSPSRPDVIISGMPPAVVATTGRRIASASSTDVPSPSRWLGNANTSAARSSAGTSVRKPGSATLPSTPSSRACRRSASSNSPSPAITKRAPGCRSSTAGAAATRNRCPLWSAQCPTFRISGEPARTPNSRR